MSRKRSVKIKSKPTFAVVVDGDCELWYLQMLKRHEKSIVVNIEPKIPQRKKLSEQYANVIKLAEDYTKVFWILDFDVILSETKKAKKGARTTLTEFSEYKKNIEAKYSNITTIINNPCIEFWLLLHFETTSKLFSNCEEAERKLKRYLKDYEKTQKYYTKDGHDLYSKLKPNLIIALKNAKKLAPLNLKDPDKAMSQMQLFFETNEFGDLFKEN